MKKTEKCHIVVVVDDDYRMREALENLLESFGYAVHTFSSAEECLESQLVDDINCVISDVKMPGMDGFHFKKQIQSLAPHLPVILISGEPDCLAKVVQSQDEPEFCFNKPFDCRELINAIEAASRGDQSPSGHP